MSTPSRNVLFRGGSWKGCVSFGVLVRGRTWAGDARPRRRSWLWKQSAQALQIDQKSSGGLSCQGRVLQLVKLWSRGLGKRFGLEILIALPPGRVDGAGSFSCHRWLGCGQRRLDWRGDLPWKAIATSPLRRCSTRTVASRKPATIPALSIWKMRPHQRSV